MAEVIDKQTAFIDSLVEYVENTHQWETLDKRESLIFGMRVLISDPGAAQDFLDACEIDTDQLCRICTNVHTEDVNQLQFNLGEDANGDNYRRSEVESV